MIYSVLEFCLNSVNGPFYGTPEHIVGCGWHWAFVLPYLSLYVAFVGVKTPLISFMTAQTLLLFRLISMADLAATEAVGARTVHNSPLNLVLRVLLSPVLVSVGVTYLLHVFYQIRFRRSIAIAGRVSHAICSLLTRVVISGRIEVLIMNFLFNKILSQICMRVYIRHKGTFCTVIFSFIGTYYFLKTICRCRLCHYLLSDGARFEFLLWKRNAGWQTLFVSYVTFGILFGLSFASQSVRVGKACR